MPNTKIIGRVELPDGTTPANAYVRFIMSGFDTDAPDSATIINRPIDTPIDASGNIDVDLWPNQDGVRVTYYRATVWIRNAHSKDDDYKLDVLEVPSTGGPYTLNELLAISSSAPANPSIQDQLDAKADQSEVYDLEQQIAEIAVSSGNGPYATVSDGLAATSDGDVFTAYDGDRFVGYQNDNGAALELSSFASLSDVSSYSSRYEFEASIVGSYVGSFTIGDLHFAVDPNGTAIESANGVKASPLGDITPNHFGAVSDVTVSLSGAITSGSKTLTGGGLFAAEDVGKAIKVEGAGVGGGDLVTVIDSYVGASEVTLLDAADATVSGANVTWGTDNTAAFDAAFAYMDVSDRIYSETIYARNILTIGNGRALHLRGGHYIYNGNGFTPESPSGRNISIIGDDAKSVFIEIFSDAYLIDYSETDVAANSIFCEGFTTIGGKGLYLNRRTTAVPQAHQTFNRVHVLGFSEVAIGSVWGDSPRWAVTNSVIETTRPNTKGILVPYGVANPDYSNTTIIGCTYRLVLSDYKMALSFISGLTMFSLSADDHEADIWIQPVNTAVHGFSAIGQGVVISRNRFSNEHREGKPVVLIAAPDGVGDYWAQGHDPSPTSHVFRDWQLVDNVISGAGSTDETNPNITGPVVLSYSGDLGAFRIKDNSLNSSFTHLLKLETEPTSGYTSDGIIGPNDYTGAGERPAPCNLNIGVWHDRIDEIGSLGTPFSGGSGFDPNYQLISSVSGDPVESGETTLSGATRTGLVVDALGNASNAHEYTFSSVAGYVGVPLEGIGSIAPKGNIFVEVDLKASGARSMSEVDVVVTMVSAGGGETVRRGVPVSSEWNTVRIPVSANQSLTGMTVRVYPSADAFVQSTSDRIAIGRPRVYRANRPVNSAHVEINMAHWLGSRIRMNGAESGQSLEVWPDWTNGDLRAKFGKPSTETDGQLIPLVAPIASFTPILEGATTAGVGTYTANEGFYTQVGKEVTGSARVIWTGHTGTGQARISLSGLPAVRGQAVFRGEVAFTTCNGLTLPSGSVISGYIDHGTTNLILNSRSNGSDAGLSVQSSGVLYFRFAYTT